jgi:hypothetical protein
VEIVSDLAIKCFLYLGSTPGVPRHLYEDNAVGVIDAKIALLRKHQLVGGVTGAFKGCGSPWSLLMRSDLTPVSSQPLG